MRWERVWVVRSKLFGWSFREFFGTVAKTGISNEGSPESGAAGREPNSEVGISCESLARMPKGELQSLAARLTKALRECDTQRFAYERRMAECTDRVAHLRAELERLRPVQERVVEVNGRLAQLEEALQEQARIILVKDKMIEELMKPESRRRQSRLLIATRKLT